MVFLGAMGPDATAFCGPFRPQKWALGIVELRVCLDGIDGEKTCARRQNLVHITHRLQSSSIFGVTL